MNYSLCITEAISFIQQHLSEKLSLNCISQHVGYSESHFHRIFKKETGLSLYDYIKQQRLKKSTLLLNNTNMSILDIAMLCQFSSQEAFTRAFKDYYHITPKKYRLVNKTINSKGEMIMEKQNSQIKGWFKSGSAADKFDISLDHSITHLSNQSAHLYSTEVDILEDEFGTIMQQFKANSFIGKRVKFSAFIKTDLTDGRCGLWMRIDSKYFDMLAFDNMRDRMITESTDWNFYSCVLDVPEKADIINIGILLLGHGDVWVDSCQFKVVNLSEPVTEIYPSQFVPDLPEHLDFC